MRMKGGRTVVYTTELARLERDKWATMIRHGLLSAKVSMSEERMVFAFAAGLKAAYWRESTSH